MSKKDKKGGDGKGKSEEKKNNKNGLKPKNLKSDGLFKSVFGTKIAAQEFLGEHLPKGFREMVDLRKIEVTSESYVEEDLQKRMSDVVYRVGMKNGRRKGGENDEKNGKGRGIVKYGDGSGEEAFIYCLIEHTSSNDHLMAYRVWKYVLLLLGRYIEDNKIDGKKKVKLPLVFPLVVYGGKGKYTAATNLWELFENAEMARSALASDYALVDLQGMGDEDIRRDQHIAIVKYMLKHIRDRDLVKAWDDMFKLFPDAVMIDRKNDYVYIRKLLWYSVDKIEAGGEGERLRMVLKDNLNKDGKNEGDKVMKSLADKWREEGIEKERFVIAQNLLQSNVDRDTISKSTGLSIDQINKIKINCNL